MFSHWMSTITNFLWIYCAVIACIGVGIYFTWRLRFIQLLSIPHAFGLLSGKYDNPDEEGEITHFQALSAALSGTLGIGNISGVAIAIAAGGPGAIFWMWVSAFIGMATKYAECTLGTLYRTKDETTGEVRGGPMHYITNGLGEKWKPLAVAYAVCMAIGAFGVGGMFQSNQAASAIHSQFGISMPIAGLFLGILLALVILGGITRIANVASKLIPSLCFAYIGLALWAIATNFQDIPAIFKLIFHDAFTGTAVLGGALGEIIRIGIRRAVFSNEAGLGSASVAHSAVKTDHPVRQGIVSALEPFIDTIVVCSATAIIIISSGSFGLARFHAVHPGITFNNIPALAQTVNTWTVSETSPKSTTLYKDFSEGNQLHFKGENSFPQKSPIFPIKDLTQGESPVKSLRFSVYFKDGTHHAEFLNTQGKVVKRFPLTEKQKELQGTPESGKWHHRLMELTPEDQNLALRFSSAGTGTLYIDNIESVKESEGITLTAYAFDHFYPGFGFLFICISAVLFAFTTMITWSYYGETAAIYIFGKKVTHPYKWLFVIGCILGTTFGLTLLVDISDLLVGFMVIPNAIAILALSGVVIKDTQIYFKRLKAGEFKEFS